VVHLRGARQQPQPVVVVPLGLLDGRLASQHAAALLGRRAAGQMNDISAPIGRLDPVAMAGPLQGIERLVLGGDDRNLGSRVVKRLHDGRGAQEFRVVHHHFGAGRRVVEIISGDAVHGRRFDRLITVCDTARQHCPYIPGIASHDHWSIADPSSVEGSAEERLAAFRRARDELGERIRRQMLAD
jgi:hypothetical protein